MSSRIQAAYLLQKVWGVLLTTPEPISFPELYRKVHGTRKAARTSLDRLVHAGLVERSGEIGIFKFRLTEQTDRTPMPPVLTAAGEVRRREPPIYQRIWSAIRVLKTFDLPLLQITTSAKKSTVQGYMGALQRAGYVRMSEMGNSKRGEFSTFKLVRNTGPKAPFERRRVVDGATTNLLIDPNSGAEHNIKLGKGVRRHRECRSTSVADGGVG